ncbi:LPS assembly lipoprotein LptE [Magnetococcus sp. PR-3]|uniref:LPS assembly lipoprotein LptE n=1 Tax=Magnetococcus sp. PR-3 TaxID=3120355 RepID=UPI002FCE49D3
MNSTLRTLLVLSTLLLGACMGYRFPGATAPAGEGLPPVLVQVKGQGTKSHPRLARLLQERLQLRLGGAPNRHAEDLAVLVVEMSPTERVLRLQEQSGRSDHYRISVSAQPMWKIDGKRAEPKLPRVEARANYYEMQAATTNQAASDLAREEAVKQLVDSLANVLYETPRLP